MAARWSKKDYELVAATLKRVRPVRHTCDRGDDCPMVGDLVDAYDVGAESVVDLIVGLFAGMFTADSPRFDRERFEAATGATP